MADNYPIMGGFRNICDKEVLQTYFTFMGVFITIYEAFSNTVVERVESFLCYETFFDKKRQMRYKHSPEYLNKIVKRTVDEHGNKDVLKASMLWFVDEGAISSDEYELFLRLKAQRNSFSHEMANHLWEGLSEDVAPTLVQLYELYLKFDKWWINEIEIPTSGEYLLGEYDTEDVRSFSLIAFEMIINTLYGGKSEEYMKMINELAK